MAAMWGFVNGDRGVFKTAPILDNYRTEAQRMCIKTRKV